jgi:hypothetical protein
VSSSWDNEAIFRLLLHDDLDCRRQRAGAT